MSTNLEEFLKIKFNEDKLNEEIENIIKEYNGLINRDTAYKILAKKNGYESKEKITISNIKKGMRSINLDAEVISFFPIYESKGEVPFKCQRIMIKDGTGTIPVVFWNNDINFLEKEIGLGDKIEIIDIYENNGELNYTYRTKVNIKNKIEPIKFTELKDGLCTVKGRIVEIFPDYYYKKNNEEKVMSSFNLMDGKDKIRVIVWDNIEGYKGKLTEGDIIKIESGLFKSGEIHINNFTRVVTLEKAIDSDVVVGKIQDVKLQNEELVIFIEDKLLFLKDKEIFNFLKISDLSEDIRINTIYELKKDELINKEFSFSIIEENNKIYGKLID
ncbi:MAG: hypothetical protein WC356_03185 [Candidatus Micrarchaeia archaeon]|jgi:hypothetical protein